MAKLGISTGSSPNDGNGDTLLSGAIKINSNFSEIYSCIGDGTNITNSIGYSILSGVSTYSQLSGISTSSQYSLVSGISTLSQNLTGNPNVSVGVITSLNGFITTSTTPGKSVQILLDGTTLSLNVVGVGSTNLQLY